MHDLHLAHILSFVNLRFIAVVACASSCFSAEASKIQCICWHQTNIHKIILNSQSEIQWNC